MDDKELGADRSMGASLWDKLAIQQIRESVAQWEETDVRQAEARIPERKSSFTTMSGAPVDRL